jgi:spore coat polysaccharide biosynthesis protein SpsF
MAKESTYGIVVQARMSSSRLPGKVLMDVAGKPMLERQIERLRAGVGPMQVIVATSSDSSDDPIGTLCAELGVPCFRGPLDDVMNRFILCANAYGLTSIVRVGGDDPLIDPACCVELVRLHRQNSNYDFLYASNREGWPYGCAAELIVVDALERIHAMTDLPLYLEHTVPYFFDHPGTFQMLKVHAPKGLCRPELAFTVDYPEDLELVRVVFRELRDEGDLFPLSRVIRLMDERPELRAINAHLHTGFSR